MYQRWDDYRKGRDRLDSVAHFYLTELRRAVGQEPGGGSAWQKVAEEYRINQTVLKQIWKLSSNHVGRAEGKYARLQPEEQRFLKEATNAIFMQVWIRVRAPDEPLVSLPIIKLNL